MTLEDKDFDAAMRFPALAQEMIEIVRNCYSPLGELARLEQERLRQQVRANNEAVWAAKAEEELEKLRKIAREVVHARCCGSVESLGAALDALAAALE